MEKQFIETMFDIQGKVALVTGATGNLGKAVAEGYGLAGAKVMLTGRSEKKLEPLRKELAEKGIECAYAAGDPAVEEDVVRVVEETVREFGGIDILAWNMALLQIYWKSDGRSGQRRKSDPCILHTRKTGNEELYGV